MRDLFKTGDYQSLAFFTLPHHHPVLQYLRKGVCIVEDRYFDISGWRVKLINLHSSLQKLIPLFEQRLAQSQFAGWQAACYWMVANRRLSCTWTKASYI